MWDQRVETKQAARPKTFTHACLRATLRFLATTEFFFQKLKSLRERAATAPHLQIHLGNPPELAVRTSPRFDLPRGKAKTASQIYSGSFWPSFSVPFLTL